MTYGSPVPVVLRELTPADAVPLEELLCDPVVMEFGDLRTPDGCVAFVEDAMAMYEEYGMLNLFDFLNLSQISKPTSV